LFTHFSIYDGPLATTINLQQGVTLDEVQTRIDKDTTGKTLHLILDKYAVHLISNGGENREMLARISVMSYFGQIKNWLVDMYPAQGVVADKKLRKIGSTLSSYCTKRPNELPGKQAPPCTKADLKSLCQVSLSMLQLPPITPTLPWLP
jgi:hypothetical protein